MTRILFVPWENRTFTEIKKKFKPFQINLLKKQDENMPGAEHRWKNASWIEHVKQINEARLKYFEEQKKLKIEQKDLAALIAKARVKAEGDFFEVIYIGEKQTILENMTDGQIYIRGHCFYGQPFISSGPFQGPATDFNENKPGWAEAILHTRLGAAEVAKRLCDSGLEPKFKGKIKCYNCHSAEGVVEYKEDEYEFFKKDNPYLVHQRSIHDNATDLNNSTFAQMFTNEMAQKGFRNCSFYGYRGALSSFYEFVNQDKPLDPKGYKTSQSFQRPSIRASEARVEIKPTT